MSLPWMGGPEGLEGSLAATFEAILPHPGERRLVAGAARPRCWAMGHPGGDAGDREARRRGDDGAGMTARETGKGPHGRARTAGCISCGPVERLQACPVHDHGPSPAYGAGEGP